MAQELRIALKIAIPFDLEANAASVSMIEILQKARSDIIKKCGLAMDLDHAVVTPRAPKAAKVNQIAADEVVAEFEKTMAASAADIVETEKPVESAESLLSGPSFKELAAAAKLKREAEKAA